MGEIYKYTPSNKIVRISYFFSSLSLKIANVGAIENGIRAASWSPNEERLIIATGNKTLLIMDTEFDAKNETTIDDGDETGNPENNDINQCNLSWRGDAKFFTTNYSILEGHKSLTRDLNLTVIKSPARSDASGGVVKSVSEKPLKTLSSHVTWQPNGSLIAGYEKIPTQTGGYK